MIDIFLNNMNSKSIAGQAPNRQLQQRIHTKACGWATESDIYRIVVHLGNGLYKLIACPPVSVTFP